MWDITFQLNKTGSIQKYFIRKKGNKLSYEEVIQLWINDEAFRETYISSLQKASFDGYFWETPPITKANIQQPFEFVLVKSAMLPRITADSQAFQNQFGNQENGIVTFPNLGGDATLVAPVPISEDEHYAHLAIFIQNAPHTQIHSLWRAVGLASLNKLSNQPMWISTAGLGVSWLHIRLDSRPKYYRFTPYKDSHYF
ncbi:MAG: hypothetical protein AAF587_16170 [Bacteroidota bacterium]